MLRNKRWIDSLPNENGYCNCMSCAGMLAEEDTTQPNWFRISILCVPMCHFVISKWDFCRKIERIFPGGNAKNRNYSHCSCAHLKSHSISNYNYAFAFDCENVECDRPHSRHSQPNLQSRAKRNLYRIFANQRENALGNWATWAYMGMWASTWGKTTTISIEHTWFWAMLKQLEVFSMGLCKPARVDFVYFQSISPTLAVFIRGKCALHLLLRFTRAHIRYWNQTYTIAQYWRVNMETEKKTSNVSVWFLYLLNRM